MSAPTPISSSAERSARGRRLTLAVLLWLYGISITVFLFSIWGRSVVGDTALVSDAASRAANSELVSSRVEGWFDGVLTGAGLGEVSGELSGMIAALPEVRSATAEVVGELVHAAADPGRDQVVVDVAGVYREAVPAVTAALDAVGAPVTRDEVEGVVARLEPLVIDAGGEPPIGPRSAAARSLTVATLVALGAMVLSGTGVVYAAEDRRAMFRTLLNRLAVSAFTYFVFFQISAWVLDPRGGQASVRGGLSQVVGSNLWIPLVVGAVAAAAGWAVRYRRVRRPGRERAAPTAP